ncbi:CLIP-associating protein 1 [Caerostris extrusa]|uniref:CLIP-associating protein 1 n=1 Tax=Caerostris extrusa TaxID=172846 RepID=A0AAV4SG56_CAEEX|nr:CLIP-associating protein 1 [Caerostris extrusa]
MVSMPARRHLFDSSSNGFEKSCHFFKIKLTSVFHQLPPICYISLYFVLACSFNCTFSHKTCCRLFAVGQRTDDETDSKSQSSTTKTASKKGQQCSPVRRTMFIFQISTHLNKKPSMKSTTKPMSSGGGAGGADEEMFIKSFEDVPRITLYSAKELETELTKIKDTLGDPSNDWEKRVEMCKTIRSLIVAGGQDYDEFYPHLRLLEQPFQTSVKDLRSQVVREASITIAFLSQQLGSKLDHFSEALLPCLINLIPNSAKIMSTAGIVAIRFYNKIYTCESVNTYNHFTFICKIKRHSKNLL